MRTARAIALRAVLLAMAASIVVDQRPADWMKRCTAAAGDRAFYDAARLPTFG